MRLQTLDLLSHSRDLVRHALQALTRLRHAFALVQVTQLPPFVIEQLLELALDERRLGTVLTSAARRRRAEPPPRRRRRLGV